MDSPGQFRPRYSLEDNWPAFIEEVWKHLEHYNDEDTPMNSMQ